MSTALEMAQVGLRSNEPALAGALRRMRAAQRDWASRSVRERCTVLRQLRSAIALQSAELVEAIQQSRDSIASEILASEVLPLADACRFVEKIAPDLLRTRRMGTRLRPAWLTGVALEIRREPLGIVLILAPTNYSLMIPGIQAIQAMAAGNAVLLKPGVGGSAAAKRLRTLAVNAGIDPDLFVVMGEGIEEGQAAIAAGVDKILFTGSSRSGRNVLADAAQQLTPVTAELSGCDAVFVLPGADIPLVAKAVRFGLSLNQSRTCMRPHRIFAHSDIAEELLQRVLEATADLRVSLDASAKDSVSRLIESAQLDGVEKLFGEVDERGLCSAIIVRDVPVNSALWCADIFAPVLAFQTFSRMSVALEQYNECRYGLGVSIFAPAAEAAKLAGRINAGVVVVNDIVVPTADPRLPLSGRGESGFGVTRGAEGLLDLTRVKAVAIRNSGYKHLDSANERDAEMFTGYLRAAHSARWRDRWRGATSAVAAARARMKGVEKENGH